VTAVSASEMACVWAHQTRFRLLTDFISSATRSTRLINRNAQRRAASSVAFGHGVRAPPVAPVDPPPLPDPTPESRPGERWRSYQAGPDQWESARALRARAGRSRRSVARSVHRRMQLVHVSKDSCRSATPRRGGAVIPESGRAMRARSALGLQSWTALVVTAVKSITAPAAARAYIGGDDAARPRERADGCTRA
jgi:hypothetical protein